MLSHRDIMNFTENLSDIPRSPRHLSSLSPPKSPKNSKKIKREYKEEMTPCYNFYMIYLITKVAMTKIRKLLKKYVPHEHFLHVMKDDDEEVKFPDDDTYLKEKGSKRVIVYLSSCRPLIDDDVCDIFHKENIMIIKNLDRIRPIEKK